jgi:hypothetical protein
MSNKNSIALADKIKEYNDRIQLNFPHQLGNWKLFLTT